MDPMAIVELFRRTVTEHYFDMRGRVGRAEFWYFILACFVVGIVAGVITMTLFVPLNAVVGLALILPMAGMGARRLQDVGQNGQLIWLLVIPSFITQMFGLLVWGPFAVFGLALYYLTIGWLLNVVMLVALIAAIYYWVQPGDPSDNAYGPPPGPFDPRPRPTA